MIIRALTSKQSHKKEFLIYNKVRFYKRKIRKNNASIICINIRDLRIDKAYCSQPLFKIFNFIEIKNKIEVLKNTL